MPSPSSTSVRRSRPLSAAQRALVEAGGNFCRKVGLPRSLGQIYGLLFLSPAPMSLEDIARSLGISKASVSVGTRQLLAWSAIRQVWVKGTRRDHFEAVPELREVLGRIYQDFFRPTIDISDARYERLKTLLEEDAKAGKLTPEEEAFCRDRIRRIGRLQERLKAALPLLEELLNGGLQVDSGA